MELFKDCKTYYCITIDDKDPLLTELKKKLEEELKRCKEEFSEKSKKINTTGANSEIRNASGTLIR